MVVVVRSVPPYEINVFCKCFVRMFKASKDTVGHSVARYKFQPIFRFKAFVSWEPFNCRIFLVVGDKSWIAVDYVAELSERGGTADCES